MVLGADQTLALGPKIYHKPASIDAARHQLSDAGQTHALIRRWRWRLTA